MGNVKVNASVLLSSHCHVSVKYGSHMCDPSFFILFYQCFILIELGLNYSCFMDYSPVINAAFFRAGADAVCS